MRRSMVAKFLSVLGAAALVAILMDDGNKCCPNCQGCGNNWACTGAILEAIGACCGLGGGDAECRDTDFCVECDAGNSCGCDLNK